MSCKTDFQIGGKGSPKDIYKTLTEPERLAQWWTETRGSGKKVEDTLEFWFGDLCQKCDVTALKPGKQVIWKASKGSVRGNLCNL